MNNSILPMAKGGRVNSGMATVLLVMTFAQGALMMEGVGAAGWGRDC